MTWLSAVPAIAIAVLVLLLPGALLAWGLRARGFALFALAPVMSVSLVAVAALAGPVLGYSWSIVPVAVLACFATAMAWAVRKVLARRWPEETATRRFDKRFYAAVGGVALGALIIGARLVFVFGSPDSISQTFDNIFHLNAIQYIYQTGQASSLTIGGMTGIPFYPAAWHAFAALVGQLSGASIPVAVNAANLAIGALVWPLGCVYFCQQVFGQKMHAALLTGVLSAGFGAFPILMVDFGVLYPNLLSIALLPGVLALGVQTLGLSTVPDFSRPVTGLALILALPGMSFAHPSTTMAFLVFLLPALCYCYIRAALRWRADWPASRSRFVLWTLLLLAGAAVFTVLWDVLRPPADAAFWPPIHSYRRAIFEILTSSPMARPPAVLLTVLLVVGLVVLARRRKTWWILGLFAVASILFILVSGFHPGDLRNFATGTWYNDSFRLAALLPAATLVPAAAGAIWLWERCRRCLWRPLRAKLIDAGTPAARRRTVGSAAGFSVIALTVIALLAQTGSMDYSAGRARINYQLRADSQLLTADERAILGDLDRIVPPDSIIAANPWNGSALAYALADRKTLQLHVLSPISADDAIIYSSLRDAVINPAVCPAVRNLNVRYVLDFGTEEVNDGSHPTPGLMNLEAAGVVTLVEQRGDAALYRLTACT